MTVTEMRYGALKAGWGELRRRGLERDLARLVVVQPDDQLMQACADLRVRCEQAGHGLAHKVHEADRWVAATAIRLGVDLVSDDNVFEKVPGLVVTGRRAGRDLLLTRRERTIEIRAGQTDPARHAVVTKAQLRRQNPARPSISRHPSEAS